jgi:hypothetical protein
MIHVADPEQALLELRRVLDTGGRLAILEVASVLEGSPGVVESSVHNAIVTRHWRPEEIVAQTTVFLPVLLAHAGFTDVVLSRAVRHEQDFTAVDSLLRLQAGGAQALQDGLVTESELGGWFVELRSALDRGEVAMRSEAYIFAAKSP